MGETEVVHGRQSMDIKHGDKSCTFLLANPLCLQMYTNRDYCRQITVSIMIKLKCFNTGTVEDVDEPLVLYISILPHLLEAVLQLRPLRLQHCKGGLCARRAHCHCRGCATGLPSKARKEAERGKRGLLMAQQSQPRVQACQQRRGLDRKSLAHWRSANFLPCGDLSM